MGIHQAVFGGYPTSSAPSTATWSVPDSEFKQAAGASFSVDGVQTGDLLLFTQSGDNAGSITTLTGWDNNFFRTDNDPSYKEQVRIATSNEGTVSVTSDSDTEAGALVIFRCSTGTVSVDFNNDPYAFTSGNSGDPVVPSSNQNGTGTAENYSLQIAGGYLDDDTITSCTAPSGLTLVGFAGGSRQDGFFTRRSSVMIAYAVIPNSGTTTPAGAGNSFNTNGSDEWHSSVTYFRPS
tara:strand:+ start:27 stop:734 length:708 start_codon:yes stop_codon:yes gene_type:complete